MDPKCWRKSNFISMPLETNFTLADIRHLKEKQPDHPLLRDTPSLLHKSLPLTFGSYLQEAGITEGRLDFLRLPKEGILYGSGRIPIVVTEPSGRISILKEYDEYSPKEERKVLKAVSGILAPKVRYFGKKFYLEELVDPNENTSLLTVIRNGNTDEAIRLEAMAQGQLAKHKIKYAHNHTFDEINVGPLGFRITDFGTSHFFETSASRYFRDRLADVKKYGTHDFLKGFAPLNGNPDVLEYTQRKLKKISNSMTDFINHFDVLKYSLMNLKRWNADEAKTQDPWRDAINKLPLIVDTYSHELTRGVYPDDTIKLWKQTKK